MPILRLIVFFVSLLCGLGAAARGQGFGEAEYRAAEQAMDALFAAGQYAAAEAAAQQMATRAAAAFGADAPQVLDAETARANALRQQDRDAEALAIFQDVHARWQARAGALNPGTLRAGMALAVALAEAGAAEEGLPLALETLRVAETVLGPDHLTTAIWRYNVAGIYSDLGYLDEALGVYRRALPGLRAASGPQAARYSAIVARQIARAEGDLGRPDAAADAYAVAVPLVQAAYGATHPELAHTLNEYGLALWRSGRRGDLPAFLDRAEALSAAAFGADSLPMSQVLALRVLVQTQGGPGSAGFAEGLALQADLIALRESLLSPRHPLVGRARLDLAAMLADTTDPEGLRQAWQMYQAASAAGAPSRDFAYGLLLRLRAAAALPEAQLAEAVLAVAQDSQGSAAAAASLRYGQRLALGEEAAAQRYRAVTDLTEREARLQAALLEQAELPPDQRDRAGEGAMRAELAGLGGQIDALWQALEASNPGMSDLIGGGRLTLEQVQAALAPDEALVVLDISPQEGSYHIALAITADRVDWAELGWTADSFRGAAADTRAGIALRLGLRAAAALDDAPAAPDHDAPDRNAFDLDAAHWLYAETLGRLQPVFADKAHLYLDLRGPLAALPPHLLVVGEPRSGDPAQADWLIRHHALSVLPSVFSLQTIALARGRARAPQPLLAFGDPVFDPQPALLAALDPQAAGQLRGTLAPLPETAAEVRQVAGALGAGPAAVRTGTDASEAALKAAPLADYRVLHFATHGLITGDVAGQTVLGEPALALTPGQGEDGFVTVSEILSLPLRADWVVLSACNTAVGNDPDAEALSGLAQAFFYAGARALLVSHWPVESRSAAQLMTETFRLRAAAPGLRAAEAQRQAMLAMIDAPGGRWAHPAYWAPFVLVGNPD